MLSWAKHLLAVCMVISLRKKRAQGSVLTKNQTEDFLVVVECWGVHLAAEEAGFKSDGVRIVLCSIQSKAFTKSAPNQRSLYANKQHILAIPCWGIQGAFHEL